MGATDSLGIILSPGFFLRSRSSSGSRSSSDSARRVSLVDERICHGRTVGKAAEIIRGDDHPRLNAFDG